MKQLLLIFALAAMFAACDKTPPVTPEQLPVNATAGIYGVTSSTAVWPVWSVQIVWFRSGGIYGDHVGPFLVQLQLPKAPTLGDVAKYVRQPDGLPGKWRPAAIYNVTQVGIGEPVKQPGDEIRN